MQTIIEIFLLNDVEPIGKEKQGRVERVTTKGS